MDNARIAAIRSIEQILFRGAYSNIELKRALSGSDLSPGGRALYKQLCYGTLERLRLLDAAIAAASNMPLRKMSPKLICALRVGAWGILFSDAPAAKTVNETVAAVKKLAPPAASLANAVLRHLPTLETLKAEITAPAVLYSVSDEVWDAVCDVLGIDGAAKFLGIAPPAPITARVNELKTTSEALIVRLADEGANGTPAPLEKALYLTLHAPIESLPSYSEGLFHLQRISSQRAAAAIGARPGDTVFDLCCAPGGKAFTVAGLTHGKCRIYGFELHPHRAELIRAGAKRLGIDCISVLCADATKPLPVDAGVKADRILIDAPCSALGQLSRRPELRLSRMDGEDELIAIQRALLENAAGYLKEGGTLLYSTCTLSRRENSGNVHAFLENHPEFSPEPFDGAPDGELLLAGDGDGFYMAKMKKKG